jgi:hypothetical protein
MAIAPTSGTGAASGVIDPIDPGPTPQQITKLQLSLAESAKTDTMESIQDTQKTQEEQNRVAALLQEARQLQADAKANNGSTTMPIEMHDYCTEHALAMGSTDDRDHTGDEWEVSIDSLQARLNSLGKDTQQKMLSVQFNIGQYNSLLEAASNLALRTQQAGDSLLASLEDDRATDIQQKDVLQPQFNIGQYNALLEAAAKISSQTSQLLNSLKDPSRTHDNPDLTKTP